MITISHAIFDPQGSWFGHKVHVCFIDHMSFTGSFSFRRPHCQLSPVLSLKSSRSKLRSSQLLGAWAGSWCGRSVLPVLGLLPPCGDTPSPAPCCQGFLLPCPSLPAIQLLVSWKKEHLPGAPDCPLPAHPPPFAPASQPPSLPAPARRKLSSLLSIQTGLCVAVNVTLQRPARQILPPSPALSAPFPTDTPLATDSLGL